MHGWRAPKFLVCRGGEGLFGVAEDGIFGAVEFRTSESVLLNPHCLSVKRFETFVFLTLFGHAFNSESVFGAGYKRCAGCVCVNKGCVGFLNKVVVTLRRYVRDDVEQEVGDVSGQC